MSLFNNNKLPLSLINHTTTLIYSKYIKCDQISQYVRKRRNNFTNFSSYNPLSHNGYIQHMGEKPNKLESFLLVYGGIDINTGKLNSNIYIISSSTICKVKIKQFPMLRLVIVTNYFI